MTIQSKYSYAEVGQCERGSFVRVCIGNEWPWSIVGEKSDKLVTVLSFDLTVNAFVRDQKTKACVVMVTPDSRCLVLNHSVELVVDSASPLFEPGRRDFKTGDVIFRPEGPFVVAGTQSRPHIGLSLYSISEVSRLGQVYEGVSVEKSKLVYHDASADDVVEIVDFGVEGS